MFKSPVEDESYNFEDFNKKLNQFAKLNNIDMTSSKGKGDAFELLCATIFKFNGFKIESISGGSGDKGGDIVATTGTKRNKEIRPFIWKEVDDTIRYCIQCKYHSDGKNEEHATDKIATALKKYDCKKFITVTTTDFSKGQLENIEMVHCIGINGKQLSTLIHKAKKDVWKYVWDPMDIKKLHEKKYQNSH